MHDSSIDMHEKVRCKGTNREMEDQHFSEKGKIKKKFVTREGVLSRHKTKSCASHDLQNQSQF